MTSPLTSIVGRARRGTIASAVAVSVALGMVPATASAGPSTQEQVEALNSQAFEKFEAKQYEEAVALFEQAYALQPEPNYLFNIGRIYEESGNLVRSVEFYERFVKEPGVPLEARERGLERLRVLRAILEETERQAEPEVEPEPEPAPEPAVVPEPEPEPQKQRPPKLRIAGYALLGVGGAGLAAGGVLAGLALQRANRLEQQHTFEERSDTADQGRTMALTADILFGVGGALAAAGLVMVIVSLPRKAKSAKSARAKSERAQEGRPQLSPWATRRGAGLAATVRF